MSGGFVKPPYEILRAENLSLRRGEEGDPGAGGSASCPFHLYLNGFLERRAALGRKTASGESVAAYLELLSRLSSSYARVLRRYDLFSSGITLLVLEKQM